MERATRLMLYLDRCNNRHGPGFIMLGMVVDVRLVKQMVVGVASIVGAGGGFWYHLGEAAAPGGVKLDGVNSTA
jgi:hypothetical protein